MSLESILERFSNSLV